MSAILTKCPTTGVQVQTGHSTTEAEFANASFPSARFRCSACNKVHGWEKADAWVSLDTEGFAYKDAFSNF